jgi:pimeloyl-ACP methyl ester carboxylesterase
MVLDLVREGLAVIAPLLPHHSARKPLRARFSGEPFLCGDIACTIEAQLQAVRETRALLRWLRERDADPLGLVGFGLGGLVAALVCGLERDLDFGVLLTSPSRLSALLIPEPAPLLRTVHNDVRRQGLLETLEEVWRPLDTARLGLALPSSRLRILGARGDGFVPPSEVERLARVMASPLEWIGGGHGRPGGALRGREVPSRLIRVLRDVGALRAG